MISLAEARSIVVQKVPTLAPASRPLAAARGAILRENAHTAVDIPAFDRSAMDGYAVNASGGVEKFRVVAEIQPGAAVAVTLRPGECARIFTGAAVPEGTTQVVMQEDAMREGEVMIPARLSASTHIRRRGEDALAGSVLLRAGTRLGAAELSLLAQLGVTRPLVSPPVRVLHFTTGNELVDPDKEPGPGQIRDTNSTLIAALVAERRGVIAAQERCGDSLEALAGAIAGHDVASWDLLLISGGASVGDYDFGARALERLGFALHFRQINLRPGKPLIFATRGAQAAFVIPGNPVSHFVTFHAAIAAAMEALEGAAPSWPLALVTLASAIDEAPNPRETWWPAAVAVKDGRLHAMPLAWQSSGDLCGLASANGLIRIAPQTPPMPAGAEAECLLLALA